MTISADHERSPPPLLPCAIALSVAVGAVAVFGWLLGGGLLPWPGWGGLTAESAVPALYAILAVIVQATNAVAATAARWATGFELTGSARWAGRVVAAGGLWNAYSLHNAFSHSLHTSDWWQQGVAWAVSGAIAFMEIALYYIDEALKSEVVRRRRADDDAALAGAKARDAGPVVRIEEIDFKTMSEEALEAAISLHTGSKRRLESERQRRNRAQKIDKTIIS